MLTHGLIIYVQKYSLNVNYSPLCIILTVGVDRSGGKSIGSKIDTYNRRDIMIAEFCLKVLN